MSRRRRRKLPKEPFEARIEDLSHDGRGVTTHGEKKVFVHGALPGELVIVRITDRKRSFDESSAELITNKLGNKTKLINTPDPAKAVNVCMPREG